MPACTRCLTTGESPGHKLAERSRFRVCGQKLFILVNSKNAIHKSCGSALSFLDKVHEVATRIVRVNSVSNGSRYGQPLKSLAIMPFRTGAHCRTEKNLKKHTAIQKPAKSLGCGTHDTAACSQFTKKLSAKEVVVAFEKSGKLLLII